MLESVLEFGVYNAHLAEEAFHGCRVWNKAEDGDGKNGEPVATDWRRAKVVGRKIGDMLCTSTALLTPELDEVYGYFLEITVSPRVRE